MTTAPDPPVPAAPPVVRTMTLAQCLTARGWKLYGASWCHPCHMQKEWFGADAKNLPYVECAPDGYGETEECEALEFTSYPTWVMPDGRRLEGTRPPEYLSFLALCPLP